MADGFRMKAWGEHWKSSRSLTFPSLWQGRSANGAQYAQCFPSLHAIMIGHDDDQSAHISGIYSTRQPGTFGWLSALFDFSTKVYIYMTSTVELWVTISQQYVFIPSVSSLMKSRSWSRAMSLRCVSFVRLTCPACVGSTFDGLESKGLDSWTYREMAAKFLN